MVLAAILVLLSIFDILFSNLSDGFSVAIAIASTCLPAYKFAKKFDNIL
jgi:hypothetical protein